MMIGRDWIEQDLLERIRYAEEKVRNAEEKVGIENGDHMGAYTIHTWHVVVCICNHTSTNKEALFSSLPLLKHPRMRTRLRSAHVTVISAFEEKVSNRARGRKHLLSISAYLLLFLHSLLLLPNPIIHSIMPGFRALGFGVSTVMDLQTGTQNV